MDLVDLGADLRVDLVDLADLGVDLVDLGVDLVDLGADLGVDLVDLGVDLMDLGADLVDLEADFVRKGIVRKGGSAYGCLKSIHKFCGDLCGLAGDPKICSKCKHIICVFGA